MTDAYEFARIGIVPEYCEDHDDVHETPAYSGDVILAALVAEGMEQDDAYDLIIDEVDGVVVWKVSPVVSTMH